MTGDVIDTDFFRRKRPPMDVSAGTKLAVQAVRDFFTENHMDAYASAVEQVQKNAQRSKFSVAVVGEFSRGKSSFINRLFGREILPVSNLPTTALLTRIRYNAREMIVFYDSNGRRQQSLPLSVKSWRGRVVDNFGEQQIKGTALVGINSQWLADYDLEIIDTPGTGDLEQNRVKIVGDALLGCDAALIAVSAAAALSRSERLFIEERLIAKKTPYLMLIVTKLDQVPVKERCAVIDYIRQKLSRYDVDIPVYIPYELEMPNRCYDDWIGMDKMKAQIEEWVGDSGRRERTGRWLAVRTEGIIENALTALRDRKLLLQAKDEKRLELLEQKKDRLTSAGFAWEELRQNMLAKGNTCCRSMWERVNEYTQEAVEKLQYEVSNTNAPRKWWEENYAYRLKIELTNMSALIDRSANSIISSDIRWFNSALDKCFKTCVLAPSETIADTEIFRKSAVGRELMLEDINRERTIARLGTGALVIAGSAVALATGVPIFVASMGINTGAGLITEKVFSKKVEEQRRLIREALTKTVPAAVEDAAADCEKRIMAYYDNVLAEAAKQEQSWMEEQQSIIADTGQQESRIQELEEKIRRLKELKQHLSEGYDN